MQRISALAAGGSQSRGRLRATLAVLTTLAALVASAGLVACGPLTATNAIDDAEMALRDAERNKAPRLAPYRYWLARTYLDKAKVTEGYAEFEGAADFARQARDSARLAMREAMEEAERQRALDERLKRTGDAPRPAR